MTDATPTSTTRATAQSPLNALYTTRTSLLTRHFPSSLPYIPYISSLLSDLSDDSMPQSQISYLALVLAIKTRQIITSSNSTWFDVTQLQLTIDTSTHSVGLKIVQKTGEEMAVLKGEERSAYTEGVEEFLESVERCGEGLVREIEEGKGSLRTIEEEEEEEEA